MQTQKKRNGRVNEDRNRKGEDGKEGGGGGGDQIKKQSWRFFLEVSMEPPKI